MTRVCFDIGSEVSLRILFVFFRRAEPPDAERRFTLQRADVAVLDRHAYQLSIDLELLHDMAKELTEEAGKGDPRGYHALYTANEIINHFQAGDVESVSRRLGEGGRFEGGNQNITSLFFRFELACFYLIPVLIEKVV